MARHIHANETYLKDFSEEQIQTLVLETEMLATSDSPIVAATSKSYIAALKEQLTRLEIKF